MTRRNILVAGTILAAVAGLGWWFAAGSSLEASAVRPGVTLLVNLERKLVITPGTPLQMEVSLTSAPSAPGVSLGARWRPWHAYVRLEDAATGDAAPWALQFVSATSTALEPGADGSQITSTTSPVAHLERGRQVHTVSYVAAPTVTEQARPGVYRLRAVLQIPRWHVWGWRGQAVSSLVTITVMSRDDGKEGIAELEKQRVRYSAKYYLSAGQIADARRATEELLARGTGDPATHVLLGDVFVAENQADRALAEYRRALALLPRSNEEPTFLLERIARASVRRSP